MAKYTTKAVFKIKRNKMATQKTNATSFKKLVIFGSVSKWLFYAKEQRTPLLGVLAARDGNKNTDDQLLGP